MKYYSILIVTIGILFAACADKSVKTAQEDQRPNIIVIMSDDMGYSDIGSYGGDVNTPNLDRLAKNGLRFTQFYNTGRCCPTRASLMTGLHPHQTGIGHMTNPPTKPTGHNYGLPEYQGSLNEKCVTIAQVLKDTGYTTLMAGKWHLGLNRDDWPMQRGFDKFYGLIPGASNYFKPEYPRGITYMNDTITITDENYYTTDAFTENAIKFVNESKEEDSEKPFFLYLAYTAPHWPLHAPQKDVDKYKGTYMEGWTVLRDKRYEKMKEMGLIDPSWELTPQDSRDWDSLDDEKKKEMDLRRAIYSAMVDRMDQNIGKLVDNLKENNILDNTVIIFLNDNGACAEFSELGSGPAAQLETKEGYILSYGRAWANASNTPYREYKHWLHEGGMATPFIVHWPKGISKEKNGSLIKEYGFLPDIMATCVDLGESSYPTTYNGKSITPTSGKSLAPLFEGEEKRIHTEPIFWEHEGNKAVRLGKYKLVMDWEKGNNDNWELYDMEKDRTEMHNLIDKMPVKGKEMISMYKDWAKNNNILPWGEIEHIRSKLKIK